jgi:hypothetical protein
VNNSVQCKKRYCFNIEVLHLVLVLMRMKVLTTFDKITIFSSSLLSLTPGYPTSSKLYQVFSHADYGQNLYHLLEDAPCSNLLRELFFMKLSYCVRVRPCFSLPYSLVLDLKQSSSIRHPACSSFPSLFCTIFSCLLCDMFKIKGLSKALLHWTLQAVDPIEEGL